jgi:putative DNA primase/helicase
MSFDSTDEQEQQDRQDALDKFRFAEWRALLATMPDAASKLETFQEAADDIAAQFAAGRFAKPTGVDQLDDMARTYGLTEAIGQQEVERIVGQAFVRAEQDAANSKDEKRDVHARLISRSAASISPEKIDWLWAGRLARGKHTCIAGEPGTGKSQASIYVTGTITIGGDWPCDEGQATIGSVIILSAEDGPADTIIPRLMAVGADLDRVHIVSAVRNPNGRGQRTFNLQSDIELLEQKIDEIGDVALVIIDPVSSYLGKTDSHKNAEVRGVLEPLSAMAERTKVSLLSVTHFNKASSSHTTTTKALHRFMGSIAFTGAPRVAFAVIDDPEDRDRRLFLHAKNNLAAPPQGLAFRLEQTIVGDGIVASRAVWETAPVSITANQALAAEMAGTDKRRALAEAEDFLRDTLSGGPVPASDVQETARDNLISNASLRRAKSKLKVEVKREGFGPGSKVIWLFPPLHRCSKPPIDAHPIGVSTYGENEHLWSEEGLFPAADPVEPNIGKGGKGKKEKDRFRVVGATSDGTVCCWCHRPGSVLKIRDAAVVGSKAQPLHRQCAQLWFEVES